MPTVATIIPGIDVTPDDASRLGPVGRLRPVADHEVVVGELVGPDARKRVREDQPDARVAVPAVPVRELVEADQALEPGQAREQSHLDQREPRAEQAGDPGEADHPLAGRVEREVAQGAAAVDPDVEDRDRVADARTSRRASGRSRATCAAASARAHGAQQGSRPRALRPRWSVLTSSFRPGHVHHPLLAEPPAAGTARGEEQAIPCRKAEDNPDHLVLPLAQ